MLMVLLKLKVKCEEEQKVYVGECQNLLREVGQNILPDREFKKKSVNPILKQKKCTSLHIYIP